MIKTIKVMLLVRHFVPTAFRRLNQRFRHLPNKKQATRLFASAGAARFAYNWALGREQDNYKAGGKFLSDKELRKEFTLLKTKEEYQWLNEYSNNITKQAIKGWQLCCHAAKRHGPKGLPKDACNAYIKFFKGETNFPKFKKRKKTKQNQVFM